MERGAGELFYITPETVLHVTYAQGTEDVQYVATFHAVHLSIDRKSSYLQPFLSINTLYRRHFAIFFF